MQFNPDKDHVVDMDKARLLGTCNIPATLEGLFTLFLGVD